MSIELHEREEIIWEGRTSWRGMYSFWMKWLPLTLAPLIISLIIGPIAGLVDNTPWSIVIAASLLLTAVAVIAAWFKRIYSLYTVTSHRLNISSGILGKKNKNCRLDRIQNKNAQQNIIQLILGVGDIEIETAGNDEADFNFIGVIGPNELIAKIDLAQEDRMRDYGARKDPI